MPTDSRQPYGHITRMILDFAEKQRAFYPIELTGMMTQRQAEARLRQLAKKGLITRLRKGQPGRGERIEPLFIKIKSKGTPNL